MICCTVLRISNITHPWNRQLVVEVAFEISLLMPQATDLYPLVLSGHGSLTALG
jgi:hypothetical protein